ncbi:MAG TPA: bifunctional methylenetetrahydrofolate dehydrogenase/methenyltetrahydrofolate cyclohydrolase [Polyangiaceae bacterium]|nr:bifunctional methylenetetrahydrofolate dehydrogenase/methenyltetrahydrofolate cyclohydrolase [Polyangiaceae bacterium]
MARVIDPAALAAAFRDEIRGEVARLPEPLRLVGLLSAEQGPSVTYAEYTRKGCDDVGIRFELRRVRRLDAEAELRAANDDPGVHGVLIYYPVFGTEQDRYLRDSVDPGKDIEGLHSFWARCLYENRRFLDEAGTKKAILPCTPLAVLKLLDAAGAPRPGGRRPLEGVRACVFNRSEVVGRPLASMMANDGAEVVSFDVDGAIVFRPEGEENAGGPGHVVEETSLGRAEALARADVVVTGVPSREFRPIGADELRPGVVCVNFSTIKNFRDDVVERASAFVPRVGPMTVTMALRNTLRLYRNARA